MIKLEAHSRPDKHDGKCMNLTIAASGSAYDIECELRALLLHFYKQIYANEGPKTVLDMIDATISAMKQFLEEI